jgi:hypothetical protein
MKVIFELGTKDTTGSVEITVNGAPETIGVGEMAQLSIMPDHIAATITRKVWVGGANKKLIYQGTVPLSIFEFLVGNKVRVCDW